MIPDSMAASSESSEIKVPRALNLFGATMMVAGSMIGSGIFIVTGEMARDVGGAGWLLLAWVITALTTIAAALSYGELAAMMPKAGGQYVYLREGFSPFWAFLYGWTLFFVLQAGLIDAISIGFARYLGVLWPAISENLYLVGPIGLGSRYALSLSTTQLTAIILILLLAGVNIRGIQYGTLVQNVFTVSKMAALAVVICFGLFIGAKVSAIHANFAHPWILPQQGVAFGPPWYTALVVLCLAQVGSMFAADAWNNVTFIAGEIRRPARNLPLSLLLGTSVVMVVYILVNLAYTVVLPMNAIQHTPSDRVGGAMLGAIYPRAGNQIMAVIIIVAAAGCVNGIILAGGRTFYAMARDGLFFAPAARLNRASVPGVALLMECAWACVLLLVRTHNPATGTYGNLYSNLLDYVISAALFFYILTISCVWRLRRKQPHAERPYKTVGYPWIPLFYIAAASTMLVVLCRYKPATTLPGFLLIALCAPVYLLFDTAAG
jgi:APA family basic amino acid/polyamine antiporter